MPESLPMSIVSGEDDEETGSEVAYDASENYSQTDTKGSVVTGEDAEDEEDNPTVAATSISSDVSCTIVRNPMKVTSNFADEKGGFIEIRFS